MYEALMKRYDRENYIEANLFYDLPIFYLKETSIYHNDWKT